jgi:hypothetical protein
MFFPFPLAGGGRVRVLFLQAIAGGKEENDPQPTLSRKREKEQERRGD